MALLARFGSSNNIQNGQMRRPLNRAPLPSARDGVGKQYHAIGEREMADQIKHRSIDLKVAAPISNKTIPVKAIAELAL